MTEIVVCKMFYLNEELKNIHGARNINTGLVAFGICIIIP
jgi:hypothetical protein